MADYNPNINESITVSESTSREIPVLHLNLSDSITVSEFVGVVDIVNTSDSITATESTSLNLVCYFDSSDSVTVTEYKYPVMRLAVSVADSITVTGYILINYTGELADLYVAIQEWITVSEDEEAGPFPLTISKADSITVSEFVGVADIVNTSDSVTVSESVSVGLTYLELSVSDSVSLTEDEQLYEFPLNVYDIIYTRDLFVQAMVDDEVEGVRNTIAVTQLLLASATRTAATYLSAIFKVQSAIYLRFHQDVTAENGTANMTIILQTSPDKLKWYDAVTATKITATGQYSTTMTEPGIYVRAKYVIAGSGSPSFTFVSKLTKYMPVGPRKRKHTYITKVRK